METAAAVEKERRFFHSSLQNAWGVLNSSHRLGGGQTENNKTGQIICYKNRTFLFATDTVSLAAVGST
jgi:hypothetical protein